MWQWLHISFDITEFVCCWKITNTVQWKMYSGDFSWISVILCLFIYDSWKAGFQYLMCSFLFFLCKVVSLFSQLKVASNINIGCIIHMKAEEVACSCLHATCIWNLWIIWWSCDVRLLGLQFVYTIQNDFTSRTRLLSQQLPLYALCGHSDSEITYKIGLLLKIWRNIYNISHKIRF